MMYSRYNTKSVLNFKKIKCYQIACNNIKKNSNCFSKFYVQNFDEFSRYDSISTQNISKEELKGLLKRLSFFG